MQQYTSYHDCFNTMHNIDHVMHIIKVLAVHVMQSASRAIL